MTLTSEYASHCKSPVTGLQKPVPDVSPVAVGLDSQTLLRGEKSVTIVHEGAAYRLQATRLGKLILTK
jgi:hemin uptake protein HemP